MYRTHKKKHFFLFLVTAFTLVHVVYALPEDRREMLHIKADNTIYNYKTGINYFEGNVQIDQGSTHVTADRLITKANSKHQIQEAIAYGIHQLARFTTTPRQGEKAINANARIIKFYPLTMNATLQGEVFVLQGENIFQGQLIHYNMNEQTIIVPETKNGRAVLVYNPD